MERNNGFSKTIEKNFSVGKYKLHANFIVIPNEDNGYDAIICYMGRIVSVATKNTNMNGLDDVFKELVMGTFDQDKVVGCETISKYSEGKSKEVLSDIREHYKHTPNDIILKRMSIYRATKGKNFFLNRKREFVRIKVNFINLMGNFLKVKNAKKVSSPKISVNNNNEINKKERFFRQFNRMFKEAGKIGEGKNITEFRKKIEEINKKINDYELKCNFIGVCRYEKKRLSELREKYDPEFKQEQEEKRKQADDLKRKKQAKEEKKIFEKLSNNVKESTNPMNNIIKNINDINCKIERQQKKFKYRKKRIQDSENCKNPIFKIIEKEGLESKFKEEQELKYKQIMDKLNKQKEQLNKQKKQIEKFQEHSKNYLNFCANKQKRVVNNSKFKQMLSINNDSNDILEKNANTKTRFF